MATRKILSAYSAQPTPDLVKKYDALLWKTKQQIDLAEKMTTTARQMIDRAVEMRNLLMQFILP